MEPKSDSAGLLVTAHDKRPNLRLWLEAVWTTWPDPADRPEWIVRLEVDLQRELES